MDRNKKHSSIAETARVTIRSVMAVDRVTITVTLNMTYVNFISLRWNSALSCVVSAITLNCFEIRLDE